MGEDDIPYHSKPALWATKKYRRVQSSSRYRIDGV